MRQSNINEPFVYYQKADWDGITVEYIYSNSIGEFDASLSQNVIGVAFAPHNKVVWRVDESPSQTNPLPVGTIYLCASQEFLWLYRDQASECLHMSLDTNLLNRLAADCGLSGNVAIDYRVMFADPTILHVAQLFKSEILNGGLAGKLYKESLRNLLAVHVLRNYCGIAVKPVLQDGLLDDLKLKQVKDFIEDHLDQDITLADMAAIAHMSQFHFARVFKAAIGLPPHRYLTQRRIERAKLYTQKPLEPKATTNRNGKFAGKVVLITGATSGIGEGTAYAFAKEGAKVFFCGRRENLGKQVFGKIKGNGGEATYMRAARRYVPRI